MKKLIKGAVAAAVGLQCVAMASAVQAADSVNVARNYKDKNTCPEKMARKIDAVQTPLKWISTPEQQSLI